jgi:TPR repeat protein
VGSLYLQGIGVPPDFEKAVYWYERGGPAGGWEALGTVFRYRELPDYARAAAYYERAAKLCSPIALYELRCAGERRPPRRSG